MAEASSKRPKLLLEEEEARIKLEEDPKVNKLKKDQETFQNRMEDFVRSLKGKSISPLQLKRHAVSVCFRLKLVYDDLPMEWLPKLKGMGLKLEKKEKDRKPSVKKTKPKVFIPEESPSMDPEAGQFKKLVDYTKLPPPPFWSENYAQGIVLPRMLTMYSASDKNYIFYDYNPKLKDASGNDIKLGPRKRHSFGKLPTRI